MYASEDAYIISRGIGALVEEFGRKASGSNAVEERSRSRVPLCVTDAAGDWG